MVTRRAFPLLLALFAVLAAAGLVTACGSDEADVDEVLAQTFGEEKQIRSGRLDLGLRVDVQGLPTVQGPIDLRLAGPFASSGRNRLPRFDFNLSFSGAGQAVQAGAVSTGDAGFLRFGGRAYSVGDELFRQFRDGYAQQARCSEGQEEGLSFRTLGIDPRRWLRDPRDAGSEEVGGVETTHVTAGVDVPRFLEDVNRVLARSNAAPADPCAREGQPERRTGDRQLSPQERQEVARAIRDARVEVWSGEEDRTLRRLNVALRLAVPQERRGAAGGLQGGTVRFDLVIGGLNEEQRITAPAGAQPLDALTNRFGGRIPGLGGAGAGAGAGAGGAGSGGTGADSDFLTCLERAGDDVDAQQACQPLAGS